MAFQLCPLKESTSPTVMEIPICHGGAQAVCADAEDMPSIKSAGKDITIRNNHFCFIKILRTDYLFGTALMIDSQRAMKAIQ
jgi:hypothetical protein